MSIVLGYDDSPGAERALSYSIDLARLLGDSLVLVYAAEPPGSNMGEEFREHLKALAEIGQTALDHGVAAAKAASKPWSNSSTTNPRQPSCIPPRNTTRG